MSTLSTLASGRLFAAARRGPQACRDRRRQQGAEVGQTPVHRDAFELDRMADDLSTAPGRGISVSLISPMWNNRRKSFSSALDFCTLEAVNFGLGAIVHKSYADRKSVV